MSFDLSKVSQSVLDKAKLIKCAIFDVDGVMTSGQLHYTASGEQVKVFNVLDGHGLKSLSNAGILVAVISAKRSEALIRRLDDLGITEQHLGISDKASAFSELIKKHHLDESECSYTGDDVIDLSVMSRCGLALSVTNAHPSVKQEADWVTEIKGGEGAVRSICDLILFAQQTEK